MTDLLGIAAYLLLPLFGLWSWRIPAVRRLALDGRMAVAFVAGTLTTALVMAGLSLLRIEWSRTTILIPLGAVALLGLIMEHRPAPRYGALPRLKPGLHQRELALIALFIALAAYGAMTARITCGDLEFFWAPKGIKFYRAGGIDPHYLGNPNNHFAHRDYPPLVPLIYAWSNTASRQFSWWGAVLSTVFCLAAIAAMLRSFSGEGLLAAAVLSFTFAMAYVAGGADPFLLMFQTLTICALTFVDDVRSQSILAAIGLAGAVWTKVEGATFLIAVIIAMIVVKRKIVPPVVIAIPALVLLGSWIVFITRNHLLESYGSAGGERHFELLPQVLRSLAGPSSYGLYWAPWIACLALLFAGRNWRLAAIPLSIAVLTLSAIILFYLHSADPHLWIVTSARRVLLTPLLALLVAAIAASLPLRQEAR